MLAEGLVVGEHVLYLPGKVLVVALGGAGSIVDLLDDGFLAVLVVLLGLGDGVVLIALGGKEVLRAVAVGIHISQIQRDGGAQFQIIPQLQVCRSGGNELVGDGGAGGTVQVGDGVHLLVVGTGIGDGVGTALCITDDVGEAFLVHGAVLGLILFAGQDGLQGRHANSRSQRGSELGVVGDTGAADVGIGKVGADIQAVEETTGGR